jgi:hypothetical protein
MAEPINLNKVRKAKARAQDRQAAAHNRVRFGRTKAEVSLSALEAERSRRALDQKKRED